MANPPKDGDAKLKGLKVKKRAGDFYESASLIDTTQGSLAAERGTEINFDTVSFSA